MATQTRETGPSTEERPSPTSSASCSAKCVITYFAFFDVGDEAGSLASARLQGLASAPTSSIIATYDVSAGIINTHPEASSHASAFPNLLQIYRDDMYARRIAAFARTRRFGQMYQFLPLSLPGILSETKQQLLHTDETVVCHPVVSVTNLGVACIQLWVELPGMWQIPNLISFTDPAELAVPSVDYTVVFGREHWTLQRHHISILDIMSFIATQLLCELGSLALPASERGSSTAQWANVLQTAARVASERSQFPALQHIETYTLFHFAYSDDQLPPHGSDLRSVHDANAHAIRALVTRDVNWEVKKAEIVKKHLERCSCSTRDSILWYVGPRGAVKIYSPSLETDRFVSMVLAAFEIELLLGMRFFLEKINYSLNAVRFESTSPKLLAKIHRQNVERLDSFFSLASCTKDTTADRFERLRRSFRITELSKTTAEKIGALSQLVSTRYDDRLQRSQTVLTILFGVFGLGQLVTSFIFWFYPNPAIAAYPRLGLSVITGIFGVMCLFGAALYRLNTKKDSSP